MIFSGRRRAGSLAAAAILALATAGPAPGSEADPVGGEKPQAGVAWEETGAGALDLLVLRPLGAAATVTGFALFLASAPLVVPSGGIGTSWDVFVLAPAEYTFQRPIGDF